MTFELGINQNIPFSDYVTWNACNFSTLKLLQTSDRAYMHGLANKCEPTTAMNHGSLLHAMLLSPSEIEQSFARWSGDRRTKKYREFASANTDKIIVTDAEFETVSEWAKCAREDSEAGPLLEGLDYKELSIAWIDERTGITCKARIDGMDSRTLCDVKTTAKVEPWRFENDATDMLYPAQLAFYLDGLAAVGYSRREASILAIFKGNNQLPCDCWVHDISAEVIEHGRMLYRAWLTRAAGLIANQRKPLGIARGERQTFVLPAWAENQLPPAPSPEFNEADSILI